MVYFHHKTEKGLIFPLVMDSLNEGSDKDVVHEMIEEYSLVSNQFYTVNQSLLKNETWEAKFSALTEVAIHYMDEEENEFRDLVKNVLTLKEFKEWLKNLKRLWSIPKSN